MGPVRHLQLIRLLALVVALDLLAGVAAVYARGSAATAAGSKARTSRAAALLDGVDSGAGEAPGQSAPGMKYSKRRASETGSTPAETSGSTAGSSTPTTSAPGTATSRGPAPGPGKATSSPSTATTSTTSPATTTPTGRAVGSSTAPTTTTTGTRSTGAAAPVRFTWTPVDDTAGDPVVDGTDKRRSEGRADIVRTQAAYTSSLIALNVETAQAVNPSQDRHWHSSSTFQAWELDVDGDAKPDFEVQYLFDAEEGTVTAGVGRVGDLETASLCEAQAQYWAGGYAVGFDPGCVGSPAAFSYRVKMYFDTNPDDPDADVLTDTAPNGGLSRPVTRQSD